MTNVQKYTEKEEVRVHARQLLDEADDFVVIVMRGDHPSIAHAGKYTRILRLLGHTLIGMAEDMEQHED